MSAKRAMGAWQMTVILTPWMISGAPMEAKPSTDGAVGTEIKLVLVR